jgi:hypothetical protein
MPITVEGNGRISIANTSPSAQNLHVGTTPWGGSINGYTRLAVEGGTDYAVVTIKSTSTNFSQIIFTDPTTTNLGGINYFNSNNATPNAMTFLTNGGQERMRIDSSGNIGIGTTTPTSYLTGSGVALYRSTGDSQFAASTGATNNAASLRLYNGTTPISEIAAGGSTYSAWGGNNSLNFLTLVNGGVITFNTSNGSITERMRIDSGGKVTVGTSAQTKGNLNIYSAASTQCNLYLFKNTQMEGYFGFTAADQNLYVGTGATFASGGVYMTNGGTSWTSNSDEKLKENLVPITNAITKVCSLRTVTGNFISDKNKISRPFLIAQDVIEVLPEAVSTSTIEGTEYLGVAYTDTIPLLVAAIKEQQALITSLTARLIALEGTPA